MDILNEIKTSANIGDNVSLDNLLSFQDIISINKKIDDEEIIKFLYKSLDKIIDQHISFREKEGKYMQEDILGSLSKIDKNIKNINKIWDSNKESYLEKYKQKIAKVADQYKLNNDRLFQEVAIIFDKRDINEELVRVKSHIASFIN